mmetsp:Transcript_100503/g.150665  ORF Transcript_100503/g.150665 Transcript_100503/m.150665 type:complete len:81 (-) Transcript_100503:16-258(-)
MRKVLRSNGITAETIIGSKLMEKLLADANVGNNSLQKPIAHKFMESLFKGMKIPVNKAEIEQVVNLCISPVDQTFSVPLF